MRVLLIDATSSFLDFALRCEVAGHEVRVFMGPTKENLRSKVGDGLITKVSDWKPSMKWADLIVVSDNAKYIKALEPYRNQGFPIFGPNIATTNWELERGTGQRVLQDAGIDTIPTIEFSNYDDAIALVRKTKKRYVSKPSGDADKALSYVSKSPADMIYMLEHWKRTQKKKVPFVMQEFIPGIEMAVGGWFGRGGFAKCFLENFEFKKLMNDNIGVNTGEQGTAMKYVMESKLADEVLKPLTGELFRQGYTGYIDVAVIIDEKGKPWPLEFTTRPGWPLFQIQQILHSEPCEWMRDLIDGIDSFEPYDDTAIGVVMTIPDFPYTTLTKKEVSGYPIWGVTDKNRYFVHPAEVMLGNAPCMVGDSIKNQPVMVTAGDYVIVASGRGDSVYEAKCEAYKVVKEIEIPNSPMYRTDIGHRCEHELPELQAHGYATEWEWE